MAAQCGGEPSLVRRVWRIREAVACFSLLVLTGLVTAIPHRVSVTTSVVLIAGTVYLLAVSAMGDRFPFPTWLAVALLIAILGLSTWTFLASYGRLAPVNDETTALEIGWRALAHGQNPYLMRTQLGNVITSGLGGFLLAGPVVLAFGGLTVYGLLWLYGGAVALLHAAGARATLAATACLVVSPVMHVAWPSERDFWINASAIVLLGSMGFLATARGGWRLYLTAIAFGVVMSYRLPLAVAVVPLVALMWRVRGQATATRWAITACAVGALLTIAPYIVNEAAYGPTLHALSVRAGSRSLVAALVAAVVVVTLSTKVRTLAGVWGITCVTVTSGWVLAALLAPADFGLTSYSGETGMGAILVFGIVGLVLPLSAREPTAHSSRAADDNLAQLASGVAPDRG